ncbi:MAG TPA: hypothetical protein VFF79_12135 [Conexibacter sp.]|nr:hypothetical protein [Conexibacter sp.]
MSAIAVVGGALRRASVLDTPIPRSSRRKGGSSMAIRKCLVALLAAGALLAFAGVASAEFPNYSDCPRTTTGVIACIDAQSVSGSLEIKGFTVPLGESLEIRGGLTEEVGGNGPTFVPPTGTNGFFSRQINVPGGILGIEFPIPGNAVLATAQLAGPASSLHFRFGVPITTIRLPVKVKLDNPILGSSCYIGTDSNPANINLTTGTTSPPPPNRPISGSLGRVSFEPASGLELLGATSVDNAFAVPGATGCGFLGIANPLVNLKLQLPSEAGNNTMIVTNNVAIRHI